MSSKVYSPSQTAGWMRCPMKRALEKEGWRGKFVATGHLAAIVGNAVAAGLGVYNNYRQTLERQGREVSTLTDSEKSHVASSCLGVAHTVAKMKMDETEKLGFTVAMSANGYIMTMDQRTDETISRYIKSDPIPSGWRIVEAECDLGPERGNARPDLVVRNEFGLCVVDYKTVSEKKPQYWQKNLDAYRYSHQMFHYVWGVGDKFQEEVTRYYICALVTKPYYAELAPFQTTPESVQLWYQASQAAWATMQREDEGLQAPFMAATHEDKFGPCPFQKACFDHLYDEQAMRADYIKVTREEEKVDEGES